MVRNVRNFWLEASVDGRKTRIGTGPIGKDGKMVLNLYIRDKGSVTHACTIYCRPRHDDSKDLDKLAIAIGPNKDLIVKSIWAPKKSIVLETER